MRGLLHNFSVALLALGPWGIFALSVVDSVGLPLPAALDVLLIGVGAASVKNPQNAYFTALLAVLGSIIGNIGLYMTARQGGKLLFRRSNAEGDGKFRRWFRRYGLLTVFVPAVTPVAPLPLKVFVISAGAMRTRFGSFVVVIIVARFIRYFGEVMLGLALGKDAAGFLSRYGWALAGGACGLGLLLYLVMRAMESRDATEA